jgi:hypothetical protein
MAFLGRVRWGNGIPVGRRLSTVVSRLLTVECRLLTVVRERRKRTVERNGAAVEDRTPAQVCHSAPENVAADGRASIGQPQLQFDRRSGQQSVYRFDQYSAGGNVEDGSFVAWPDANRLDAVLGDRAPARRRPPLAIDRGTKRAHSCFHSRDPG